MGACELAPIALPEARVAELVWPCQHRAHRVLVAHLRAPAARVFKLDDLHTPTAGTQSGSKSRSYHHVAASRRINHALVSIRIFDDLDAVRGQRGCRAMENEPIPSLRIDR